MVWKLYHLWIKLSRGDYSFFLLSDKQKNTKLQAKLKEHQQKHPPHQSKMIPKPSFIWKLVPYGFGVLIFSFWLLHVHSAFTWLQVWPVMLCWVQPSNCAIAHAIAMQVEICKLKFWCHYVKGILCTFFKSNIILGNYFYFLLSHIIQLFWIISVLWS